MERNTEKKKKHRDYMTITKFDIRVVENNECHKQYGIVCLNNYNRNCHFGIPGTLPCLVDRLYKISDPWVFQFR